MDRNGQELFILANSCSFLSIPAIPGFTDSHKLDNAKSKIETEYTLGRKMENSFRQGWSHIWQNLNKNKINNNVQTTFWQQITKTYITDYDLRLWELLEESP